MIAQNNVTHLMVVKDIAVTTSTRSALATGQLGLFKNGALTGSNSGAMTVADTFQVCWKDATGRIYNSQPIKYANILSKSKADYAAATQKVSYVGYNGTSGSIAIGNSDVYIMRVVLLDTTRALSEHPLYEYAEYSSDAAATEIEIAQGLITNAVYNFTSAKPKKVTVVQPALVCSAATASGEDFDGNFIVVNGNKYATASASGQYNTGSDIAVGDYVRVGATSTSAVALTDAVYKIVSISGTSTKTIEFDRPVVEASGTYATGSNYTQVIPAATATNAATHWGIKLTGVALPFEAGKVNYGVLDFEVVLNDAFDSTIITDSVAPNKGSGTYNQVAELESFLAYNSGETYRVASYPVTKTMNATLGKTYDMITINYVTDDTQGLDRNIKAYGTLMFVMEVHSSGNVYSNLKTMFGIS